VNTQQSPIAGSLCFPVIEADVQAERAEMAAEDGRQLLERSRRRDAQWMVSRKPLNRATMWLVTDRVAFIFGYAYVGALRF
jgi:hypothetical protein